MIHNGVNFYEHIIVAYLTKQRRRQRRSHVVPVKGFGNMSNRRGPISRVNGPISLHPFI